MTSDAPRPDLSRDPAWLLSLAAGLVPALAVATRVSTAAWLSAVAVLAAVAACLAVLATRRMASWVPAPAVLLAISGMLAGVELAAAAWLPQLRAGLGVYPPVTMVSCLLLGAAASAAREATAARAAGVVARSVIGLVGMLLAVALVREALGAGSVTLPTLAGGRPIVLPGLGKAPAAALLAPFGGLLVAAYVAAAVRGCWRATRRAKGAGR